VLLAGAAERAEAAAAAAGGGRGRQAAGRRAERVQEEQKEEDGGEEKEGEKEGQIGWKGGSNAVDGGWPNAHRSGRRVRRNHGAG